MGKRPFFFPKKFRPFRKMEMQRLDPLNSSTPTAPATSTIANAAAAPALGVPAKGNKKKAGCRLWMRFDRTGESEFLECDKSAIIKRVSIPARDLRILGPVFSHSSNILAREKAMVVNLEFIKAIVTAEEVLLLDPLCQEVLPFVDQLRQQLPLKSPFQFHESSPADMHEKEMLSTDGQWLPVPDAAEGLQRELPFEFQVLEIALEVVCSYLDSRVLDLEVHAYPVLDELARNVSTKNLERVRSLKSNLTRLLARVQKVREYIDDTEDYVNIQLDNQRNELIQLQLTLTIASFAIAVETLMAGAFGMNIPCSLYDINGIFGPIVGGMSCACFMLFLLVLGYAKWKKLLGS